MTLPALLLAVGLAAPGPDSAVVCDQCARWNQPHAPVHVFGNTWWKASIATVAALPCDVLLSPHPDASDTLERLSAPAGGKRPDPAQAGQCAAYAAQAKARLEARLASEARPMKDPPR